MNPNQTSSLFIAVVNGGVVLMAGLVLGTLASVVTLSVIVSYFLTLER